MREFLQYVNARLRRPIDMAGAILSGHGGKVITLSAATNLGREHNGAILVVTTNSIITIQADSSGGYKTGHQCIVYATHASGCTVTAAAGVDLNGTTAGSADIDQYAAFGLFRDLSGDWHMPNGDVS
jgi:sugar diacid utilization regulator